MENCAKEVLIIIIIIIIIIVTIIIKILVYESGMCEDL